MINDEIDNYGHKPEQTAHHRGVHGIPATTQNFTTERQHTPDAETDLGATAELGYD